jgi:hypothetical protein
MKNIILFTFVFILSFNKLHGFSQDKILYQTVRGSIIDDITKQPLIHAHIIILNSEPLKGTMTDEKGNFVIQHVPVGRHSFKISYIGYRTKLLNNLMITSAKELVLKIKLKESIIMLDGIVISPQTGKTRPNNDMAVISTRQFTIEETDKFAGSFGDISRMVVNYAGVTAISNQRNDIIIRGNNPTGLLWRLEGVDIPNPNHFGDLGTTGGAITILNNNVLSNSDFFIGAFPAEYGNALAGVFDLELRSGNNFKREHTLQLGYNGLEIGIEGPFSSNSNASYIANYRYSTLAAVKNLGFNLSVVPYYQDLTFKLNFPNFLGGSTSIFGIGGLSHLTLNESEKDQEDWSYKKAAKDVFVESDMGTIGLNHHLILSENTIIQTNIALSGEYNKTDIDSIHIDNPHIKYPVNRNQFREWKYVISSKLISKLNAKNNFQTGISMKRFFTQYNDSFLTSTDNFKTLLDTKIQFNLYQAYIQWKYIFSGKLSSSCGLHYQHFTYNDRTVLEPRFGINWNISDRHSLNFGIGLHSQLQTHFVYEIQTILNSGEIIKSNKNLDFSKSRHFIIGYNYLFNRNLRLIIEPYYQSLYNIPVNPEIPGFSMLNSGKDYHPYKEENLVNKGSGENYGIDITFERFFSNHYYFLTTLSLYESKYTGYDKQKRNTAFNGNFVLNCLGGYEFKAGKNNLFGIDVKTLWAGGRRYIPVDLQASHASGYTVYNWEHAYEKRQKDYFTLDIRIYFTLNRPGFNIEWSMDFQNITNHKNIFLQRYDQTSGKMKTEYQLGFIPVGKIKIEF